MNVTVDMSVIAFPSSEMMDNILRLHKSLERFDYKLVLINCQKETKELLGAVGFDKIIEIQ